MYELDFSLTESRTNPEAREKGHRTGQSSCSGRRAIEPKAERAETQGEDGGARHRPGCYV